MTMSKADHVDYWKKEAALNWQTANYLVEGKQFVMALFLYNLVIEKLLKAHWVRDNADNSPPRTHDLQHLHNQIDLDLQAADYDYLAVVNRWNIDTRYPDYKSKIYAIANVAYVAEQKQRLEKLKQCLLENL